jgi:hypothetical protein
VCGMQTCELRAVTLLTVPCQVRDTALPKTADGRLLESGKMDASTVSATQNRGTFVHEYVTKENGVGVEVQLHTFLK